MSRESVGRVVVETFQSGLVSNTWSSAIPCDLAVAFYSIWLPDLWLYNLRAMREQKHKELVPA